MYFEEKNKFVIGDTIRHMYDSFRGIITGTHYHIEESSVMSDEIYYTTNFSDYYFNNSHTVFEEDILIPCKTILIEKAEATL